MSETNGTVTNWDFLIGYPLGEAQQILEEEAVSYDLQFTAAPGKVSSEEDAFVIAVRPTDTSAGSAALVLVCASADWAVNGKS